jgi:2'-5' RNA ligase
MRVFAAVELPDTLRRAVAESARALVAGSPSPPRLVEPENLHVTVRFLGEVDAAATDAVLAAAGGAASAIPACDVELRGFGVFPNLHRPRILWAGVDDPARGLSRLESAFSARVAPLGFPPEDQPFVPHVTVARFRDERGRHNRRSGRAATFTIDESAPVHGALRVGAFTVFSSELTPRGARYTALGRFPLQPISTKEQP